MTAFSTRDDSDDFDDEDIKEDNFEELWQQPCMFILTKENEISTDTASYKR